MSSLGTMNSYSKLYVACFGFWHRNSSHLLSKWLARLVPIMDSKWPKQEFNSKSRMWVSPSWKELGLRFTYWGQSVCFYWVIVNYVVNTFFPQNSGNNGECDISIEAVFLEKIHHFNQGSWFVILLDKKVVDLGHRNVSQNLHFARISSLLAPLLVVLCPFANWIFLLHIIPWAFSRSTIFW